MASDRKTCNDAAKVKSSKSKTKVNVYRHVIIPLPHELDADERLELVRQITAVFRARGLPFAAAIHRPDPGGTSATLHVHIIVSARPSVPVGAFDHSFQRSKIPGLHLQSICSPSGFTSPSNESRAGASQFGNGFHRTLPRRPAMGGGGRRGA